MKTPKIKTEEPPLRPSELALALDLSRVLDVEASRVAPVDEGKIRRMAGILRALGLAAESAALHGPWPKGDPAEERMREWLRTHASAHPARFQEMEDAAAHLEHWILKREGAALQDCGTARGHVVRLFWKDRQGRERLRKTYGLHTCKHRFCPTCGRPRQVRRADEIERALELAGEWGFTEQNVRFLTLTVKNGRSIPELMQELHEAWATLQRDRWWNRNVFGWFRGTEVVTGEDGNWNVHAHVALVLWSPFMSYAHLWDLWERAVGYRAQIDVDTLHGIRSGAKGRGITRAARYITKYITKGSELQKLRNGPGGLAHLFLSTRGRRNFAVGGGCSVLRRLVPILLPSWTNRAEMALAGDFLREGVAPVRVEWVNTETGEVEDRPFHPDEEGNRRWAALGAALGVQHFDESGRPGWTVGQPCGPGRRYRRLASNPFQGKRVNVLEFDPRPKKGEPPPPVQGAAVLSPFHRLVCPRWKVFRWKETTRKARLDGTPKVLACAAVLPARRFSWRPVMLQVWAALLGQDSAWGATWADARGAFVGASRTIRDRFDTLRAIFAAVNADAAKHYQTYLRALAEGEWRADLRESVDWSKTAAETLAISPAITSTNLQRA